MNIEEVREYALSLPGVTEDQAYGESCVLYRIEGKIFLHLWLEAPVPSARPIISTKYIGTMSFSTRLTMIW